jgi:hypothetical protein
MAKGLLQLTTPLKPHMCSKSSSMTPATVPWTVRIGFLHPGQMILKWAVSNFAASSPMLIRTLTVRQDQIIVCDGGHRGFTLNRE